MQHLTPECRALDVLRLEHDWTWDQLAHEMQGAGIKMSPRTLHWVLKGPVDAKPLDRTLHKIRKFLQVMEERQQRRERRQQKPSKAAAGVATEDRS